MNDVVCLEAVDTEIAEIEITEMEVASQSGLSLHAERQVVGGWHACQSMHCITCGYIAASRPSVSSSRY